MKKRIVSTITALALCLTMLPAMAWATEEQSESEAPQESQTPCETHDEGEWDTSGETSVKKCTVCGTVLDNCLTHPDTHWEPQNGNAEDDTYIEKCGTCGKQLSSCSNHKSGKSFNTSKDEAGNEIVKCATCGRVYDCDHPEENVTYVRGAGTGFPCRGECSKCGYTWVNTHDADVSDGWQEVIEDDVTKCQLTCKTCGRVLATHTTEGAWYESTNDQGEKICVWKCKNCSTNNGVAVPRRVLNDADHQTHVTTFGAWSAPGTNGNGSNRCKRVCTGNSTCTTYENHPTEGEWVYSEDGTTATFTCTVEGCGAARTCNHASYGAWSSDGTTCTRKCKVCTKTETHTTVWSNYMNAADSSKHLNCTGRYCTVEGCASINYIDTVEELQEAINAKLTTIQPDSYANNSLHNSPITITGDVTIDGGDGGVTIQRLGYGGGTKKPTFIIEEGGSLTLKNITIRGGGGDMSGDSMIEVDGGSLILDEGAVLTNNKPYASGSAIYLKSGGVEMKTGSKITGNSSLNSGSVIQIDDGTFTMNGGEISENVTAPTILVEGGESSSAQFIMNDGIITKNSGQYLNAALEIAGGTVVLNGGSITDNVGIADDYSIVNGVVLGSGSLTINDGVTITGNTGTGVLALGELGDATITINGGTIKNNISCTFVEGVADLAVIFANGTIGNGDIGSFFGNDDYMSMIREEYGEYVDGLTDEELLEEFGYSAELLSMRPTITGGTFSTDVNAYCAEGYVATKNDTTYTVAEMKDTTAAIVDGTEYDTLDAAIAAADGKTVKLVKDVTTTVTIPEGKTITLNLNGKNITVAEGDAISNSGTLTIVGSGNVTGTVSGENVTIKGGTYSTDPTANVADGYIAGKHKTSDTVWTVAASGKAATAVTLDSATASLYVGNTTTLVATMGTGNDSIGTVDWSSSDTSVATVDGNGKVTAVANGTATITAKLSDDAKAECTVTVTTQSYGGGGGGGSSSSSTTTTTTPSTTTTGSDGSTTVSSTTTTTNKTTGAVTETTTSTTTAADGAKTESKVETTTAKDGTKTETTTSTTTAADGATTETKSETTTAKDGTKTETTTSTTTAADGATTETKSETVTATDGAKTETTTETTVAADGAKTESKSEVVTSADGAKTETVTETTVAADGATTETNKEVVTTAEGVTTSTETVKATTAEGTSAEKVTTVDETGAATTTVAAAIPTEVATVAAASGEAVTIPVEVSASKDTQTAPTITVDLPAEAGEVKVEIPVTDVTPGTVAVIVHEDGTEEIVKASALTEDGMTVALTGGATIKIVDNSKTFDDMADDHWANNAVSFVSAREIFHGTGNNSFSSEGTMTRGMIAQVLYNLDGAPEVNGNNGLTDVADSAWYSTAANWAVEAGISSGNGEGGFDPEADVTREQLAIMLWRYAGQPEATQTELPFDDADQTSSYAQAALLWANEVGIMKGRGDGTLDPQGISTRAEVAQMLMNFIQK